MEDKQKILDLLCAAVKETRDQHDLIKMVYQADTETVQIVWEYGTETVNVAMDSGIAMIRDVMKASEFR